MIASGAAGFDLAKGFASNGYDDHSPGKYSMMACFIIEVVMTMMFLFIIMGSTHGKAPAGFAPLAIGLGAGDDPSRQHSRHQHVGESGAQHRARRCLSAAGRWQQLWMFWVAPLIGGVLGGAIYRWLSDGAAPASVEGALKRGLT